MVEEKSIFCLFYFKNNIPMLLNHVPQNDDGGPRARLDCLSTFSNIGREMPPKDDFWILEDEEL